MIWMLQRTSGEAGVRLQLVRANKAQAERHEQEQRQMQLEAIHDAAGNYTLVTTKLLLKCFSCVVCGITCWGVVFHTCAPLPFPNPLFPFSIHHEILCITSVVGHVFQKH